jgi:uncharacterized membrane protein YedE/YeeE
MDTSASGLAGGALIGLSVAVLMLLNGRVAGISGLGSGCTSGHGVAGLARLSPRFLAAVLTFLASGMLTVTLLRGLV